jgi:hypothetical protein
MGATSGYEATVDPGAYSFRAYVVKEDRLHSENSYRWPMGSPLMKGQRRANKELSLINESAVRSFDEGMEETLTLHRLGLFEKLVKTLKTTNPIEAIMALIGQRTDKVDYTGGTLIRSRDALPQRFWI